MKAWLRDVLFDFDIKYFWYGAAWYSLDAVFEFFFSKPQQPSWLHGTVCAFMALILYGTRRLVVRLAVRRELRKLRVCP